MDEIAISPDFKVNIEFSINDLQIIANVLDESLGKHMPVTKAYRFINDITDQSRVQVSQEQERLRAEQES